ncbi:hypothetical protein [Staphylococcus aureus]
MPTTFGGEPLKKTLPFRLLFNL